MTTETDTARIGRLGEEAAVAHLRRLGHRLVARNWRQGHYELDIVTEHRGTLHIVEVKTRRSEGLTTPEDALTPHKQQSLRRAAAAFLATKGARYEGYEVQFDLAAVLMPVYGTPEVEWRENAIEYGW